MGNSKSQDKSFYEQESDSDDEKGEYISLISSRIEYGFRGKCRKNEKIKNITDIPEYKTKLEILPEKKELLDLFNKALRKESSLCHEYYCFYSASLKEYKMLYDVYKILHHMRTNTDIDMNSFLFRYKGRFFNDASSFIKMFRPENYDSGMNRKFNENLGDTKEEYNNAHYIPQELEDDYKKKTGDSLKFWNDHNKALMDQMISCNVNLTGNAPNTEESTLHFFLQSRNIHKIDLLKVIRNIYKIYFDDNKLNEIIEDFTIFYNKYNKGYGSVLSQIFIKKEYISENVILCGPFGKILCSPENNATLLDANESKYKEILLQELKKIYLHQHVDVLKGNLQARIIYNDDFFNSDKALIFNYTTGIDIEDYYYDLLSIANKYLPYIKNKNIEYSPYTEVKEYTINLSDSMAFEKAKDFLNDFDQTILQDISKRHKVDYGSLYFGKQTDILDSENYTNLHNFLSTLYEDFKLNQNNVIMLSTIKRLKESIKTTNNYKKINELFKEYNIWIYEDTFNSAEHVIILNTKINEILNKLEVSGGINTKLIKFILN